jgi:hypothetical protein
LTAFARQHATFTTVFNAVESFIVSGIINKLC